MNEARTLTGSRKIRQLSLFGWLLICDYTTAALPEAEHHQNSQLFTCDASRGSSYLLSIVGTEKGSLEAIVFRRSAKVEVQGKVQSMKDFGRGVRLAWTPVTTGFSFHGQGFELVGLANAAVLHDGAQAVVCHLQPAEMLMSKTVLPAPALSMGGRIRSGPGLDFITRKVIATNTPIMLVENTELSMDGYDWYRIEANDVSGYQWGGVICSSAGPLLGVQGQCE